MTCADRSLASCLRAYLACAGLLSERTVQPTLDELTKLNLFPQINAGRPASVPESISVSQHPAGYPAKMSQSSTVRSVREKAVREVPTLRYDESCATQA